MAPLMSSLPEFLFSLWEFHFCNRSVLITGGLKNWKQTSPTRPVLTNRHRFFSSPGAQWLVLNIEHSQLACRTQEIHPTILFSASGGGIYTEKHVQIIWKPKQCRRLLHVQDESYVLYPRFKSWMRFTEKFQDPFPACLPQLDDRSLLVQPFCYSGEIIS